MNQLARLVIILTMTILTLGCATQVARLSDFRPAAASDAVELEDKRPASEKATETLSLIVTSCDYSIRRLGDDLSHPSRLELFKSQLAQEARSSGKAIQATVTKYAVYLNQRTMLRGAVGKIYTGVIPDALHSINDKCGRSETSGGWYAANEVTTPNSPIVVEVDAVLNGMPLSSRVVYSTAMQFSHVKFAEPEAAKALFAALEQANRELIERYRIKRLALDLGRGASRPLP